MSRHIVGMLGASIQSFIVARNLSSLRCPREVTNETDLCQNAIIN